MPNVLAMVADLLDPPEVNVFEQLGYTPDPAQQRFHDATEFDVGYGGLAGAGKSMALLMDAIRYAATYPMMNLGIFRRTMDELRESITSKVMYMQRSLNEQFGARFVQAPYPELHFRNGSIIHFRYAETLQDTTRRQGGEYQYIGVDERQQVSPDVPGYLVTRIRTGHPGVPIIGIRSTFNPGDIGHADLKERYIERTNMGHDVYHVRDPDTGKPMRDSKGELTQQYVRFVPGERSSHINDSYWGQLGAIEDPVLRRQLAEGDWDAGGGLMFSETWRRATHVIEPGSVRIPAGAGVLRARGIDYGMTNPFCCLWGVKLTDDLVVIYRELYETGLTPNEQAARILESEDTSEKHAPLIGYLDPSCWAKYANVSTKYGAPPKSIASDYVNSGVSVMRAHNDRIGGVRLVHDALRVRADGLPRLLVYSTCVNLIKQLGGLPRSSINPEDVNTHAPDHAFDALKYLLFGLLGRKNETHHRTTNGFRPQTAGLAGKAL